MGLKQLQLRHNNMQFKRGTAADWAAENPVLQDGELGVETDTPTIKVGDGETRFADLPSISGGGSGVSTYALLTDAATVDLPGTNTPLGTALAAKADLSGGKLATSQIPTSLLGALAYQSTWNASTNTPTIPAAASGNKGWYWKVATAGATSIDGTTDWKVGDFLISNGTTFDKIDNTDPTLSILLLTGMSTASAADVVATDDALTAFGKFQAKWNAILTTIQGAVLTGIDVATTGAVTAADGVMAAIGKLEATKAPLASPALTGVPTVPTAAAATNTTQAASTAHVFAERTNTATLTGKTISGASNTFAAVPGSALNAGTVANAALADVPTSTIKGRTAGGTGAPSDITLTALAAALGVTAGGLGQVRVYKSGALPLVAVSQTNAEAGRIAIPAGVVGANGSVQIWGAYKKVTTNTADAPNYSVRVGAAGVAAASGNVVSSVFTASTQINGGGQISSILFSNHTDESQLTCFQQANTPAPTSVAITTAAQITVSRDTSAAWDVVVTVSTTANDSAQMQNLFAIVYNPDAASYAATFANIGGVVADNALLVTALAAKEDVEGADVTLTGATTLTRAAHANRRLIIDSATAVVLTIDNDATAGWTGKDYVRAYQKGVGTVTFAAGTGTPAINKSASLPTASERYGTISIERIAANEFSRQS
jgi:major tropism determinant Mtd-like protein